MNDQSGQSLFRLALVAPVVGSMVGAGIFTLPAGFAYSTGVAGALIASTVGGCGTLTLMLVFVVQTLSYRKSRIEAGIYSHANVWFGNYPDFLAAFGSWIASFPGDVACLVLIKATLRQFFPAVGDGSSPVSILSASIINRLNSRQKSILCGCVCVANCS